MKKFTILIVAAIVSIAAAVPASAQLKFGLKVGTAVNSLKFQSDNWEETFSTDNRAGFTGGAMLEFTAPMLGVGFDASVMYMHRSKKIRSTHRATISTFLSTSSGKSQSLWFQNS